MSKHKYIILLSLCLLTLFIVIKIDWWWYLLLFIGFTGLTSWGSFDIRLNYFLNAYSNNPKEKGLKIALTFDDGPHEMTEKVLDLLLKYNAKATFFCIGTQIEKHPGILQRIINEGHIVGNHTYSHSKSFGFFSTSQVLQEVTQTDALLQNKIFKKPLFFRPPFGVTNPNIAKALSKTKHHVIGWNIRSLDTVIDDESQILDRIKKRVKPGGIILLHDTSLKTVNVLEQLLLFLQSENYEMITVDKLLNISAYEN